MFLSPLNIKKKKKETVSSVKVTKEFYPQFKLLKYIYRFCHIFKCLKRSYGYQAHQEIIPF